MNLQSFMESIDHQILERGTDYYMNDFITVMNKIDSTFYLTAYGSTEYEVVVTLGNNHEILSSNCTCPYSYGPVCKHEAAAYFILQDYLDEHSLNLEMVYEAQPSLKAILNDLSKEELIHIIDEMGQKDTALKNRLLSQYSNTTMTYDVKSFASTLREIIKKYQGRQGFITYRQVSSFTSELSECLYMIEDCQDMPTALELAFIILHEAIDSFQYADDSDGDIGFLISETLDTIDLVTENITYLAYDQKQVIFDKFMQEFDHPAFEGWEDYRDTLLQIAIKFTDDKTNRKALIQKIESFIDETKNDGYQIYQNERLKGLLYEMIEIYGTEDELSKFTQENLHYPKIREGYIQRKIDEDEYEQVIELAILGERDDKESPGLVSRWKKYRYMAYKALSLHAEQQSLAKDLFMSGEFEYYFELKQLAADPKQLYIQLKKELKSQSGWQIKSLFQQLILEEDDVDELLLYVKNNPREIEEYADYLVKTYPKETETIYRTYIVKIAANATNRRQYRKICQIILDYVNIVGEQFKSSIIDELQNTYKRKPAFIDELSKI